MRAFLLLTAAAAIGGGAYVAAVPDGGGVLAALAPPARAERELHPQRVIIGIDLSKSNPLVDDPVFAAKVGARIGELVRGLDFSSRVHVRTFGSYDVSMNNFYYDVAISRSNPPDAVAADVERLVAGTPTLVANGVWKSQDKTNILAFFDNVVASIGCAEMPTTVVLASDGVEDSEYARLAHAGSQLPKPADRPFAGCSELMILGLGLGQKSPSLAVRLRSEWTHWSQAAGFARFAGLTDWQAQP